VADVLIVDRLEVLVIVDNTTDSLSTNPNNVLPEWTGLLTGGRLRVLSGRGTCCAHHGLSLLITAHLGSARRTLLFDAGREGATLMRKPEILGVDFSTVEAVVLSHGHWNQIGNGFIYLEKTKTKNRREIPVNADMNQVLKEIRK